MNDKKVDPRSILQSILGQGILPLFYWESPAVCLKVMQTLYKAGVRAVEYTNRGVAALDNFSMLKKALAMEAPDLYLGIGTVKSKKEAEAFVAAGADFIVAPIVNPEVAAVAEKAGLDTWLYDADGDIYGAAAQCGPDQDIPGEYPGAGVRQLDPGAVSGPAVYSNGWRRN